MTWAAVIALALFALAVGVWLRRTLRALDDFLDSMVMQEIGMNPLPHLNCDTCGGYVRPEDDGMCSNCRRIYNPEDLSDEQVLDERKGARATHPEPLLDDIGG